MTTPLPHRRAVRIAGLATAAVVGLGGVSAIAPAYADIQSTFDGASASVDDVVVIGNEIHLEGSGWTNTGDGGSTIAVKLGSRTAESGVLDTEPAEGAVTNPATGASADDLDIWDAISADSEGNFSADIPFPTQANTSPALAEPWAVGTTHHLTLLTGSMEEGDPGRGIALTFTIGDKVTVSSTTGGRGASADQVTLTPAAAPGAFIAGENVTATVDDASATWTIGRGTAATTADHATAAADGSLSGATLVFAGGSLRAGAHTVALTGDQGTTFTASADVLPALTFSALTQGSSGTLSLANLPGGAQITGIDLPGATFTGLPVTAADDGTATVAYQIAAAAELGTQTVTVTQTGPDATYTSSAKISPDDTVVGADKFTITSTKSGDVGAGLYQSAYSAKQKALYVSDTNGLYKLNPDTLAVEESIPDVTQVSDKDGNAGQTTFGIGVDDVNGTVWVTNTRSNTVAVYSEDDLTLLKQFTSADTDAVVSHGRDVVYDPSTNQVFISSASEGSSGEGYIAVFEGGDNDGDGTPYEHVKNIDTGDRAVFNPVSLTLDAATHTLYSPSLSSDKVAAIDTESGDVKLLTLPGIETNGRGATGIAFHAGRLYVASQNTDELLVADAATGATIKEVPTGTQPVSVDVDPVNKRVYTANFGGTTVTVTDLNGTKVANLPVAKANHVEADGRGNVYVVDKSADNKVWKITPKAAAPATLKSATPTISGTAKVGHKLTAKAGSWTKGAKLAYQWLRNGKTIKGATKASYTPVAADAGQKLSVKVTGSKTGYQTASKTSAAKRVAKGSLSAAKPKISGKAKIGKKLTAKPGKWTAGTKLHYQWFANGTKIKGATKAALKVIKKFKGKKLVVKVTGTKAGYTTLVKASAPTAKVKR